MMRNKDNPLRKGREMEENESSHLVLPHLVKQAKKRKGEREREGWRGPSTSPHTIERIKEIHRKLVRERLMNRSIQVKSRFDF